MNWNKVIFVVATVVGAVLLVVRDEPFLSGLGVAVGAMTALWLLSLALRNASIVDIFWGPGFVVLTGAYLLIVGEPSLRGALVAALVTVWAVRLALHIGVRNAGHGEDFRYQKWRQEAGGSFWWRSYFTVFLLQGVVLWVVSSPLLLAHGRPEAALGLLDLLAIGIWLVGFVFEVVADWQLSRFKASSENRGTVLRSGLWGLSRHPNYFGEALLWWGIGLLAVPAGGCVALYGPALITFLLIRISGVAMLDSALVERKPGYADYIATTPAFVPVPRALRPRHRSAEAGS